MFIDWLMSIVVGRLLVCREYLAITSSVSLHGTKSVGLCPFSIIEADFSEDILHIETGPKMFLSIVHHIFRTSSAARYHRRGMLIATIVLVIIGQLSLAKGNRVEIRCPILS